MTNFQPPLSPPRASDQPINEQQLFNENTGGFDVVVEDPDVQKAAIALKDAAFTLGAQVKETVTVLDRAISKAARANPYFALGAASSAGFIVGGGLGAPITRSVLRLGMKAGAAFLLDAAIGVIKDNAGLAGSVTEQAPRRATSSGEAENHTSTASNQGEMP